MRRLEACNQPQCHPRLRGEAERRSSASDGAVVRMWLVLRSFISALCTHGINECLSLSGLRRTLDRHHLALYI